MSLRARLLLATLVVASVALAIAGGTTYAALHAFLLRRVEASMDAAAFPIEAALDSGEPVDLALVARLAPGMFVEVRSPTGAVLGFVGALRPGGKAYTPRLPASIPLQADEDEGRGLPGGASVLIVPAAQPGGPSFLVRASPLVGGAELILAAPLSEVTATLTRLLSIEALVVAAALLAAALLGWSLVGVGLKPLAEMERTTRAIAEGEWTRRVPESAPGTEVGRLARAFNVMLDHIEAAFAARDAKEAELRRFVADASHELRTPVAAISAYAELFSRGAAERPADLARVLHGIRSETERMSALVEDLLLLARLDEGRPLRKEPVELVALAAEAAAAARAISTAWHVRLEAKKPVEVLGDPARLRQVLDNLLANVRAHTPEGTTATLTIAEEGEEAVVTCCDDGPGIPAGAAEHVFERFYRADSSRTRRSGGSGLGLAIVAAIVAAHGGRVEAGGGPAGGASFTVRLPLSPDEGGDGSPP
jgi:two-component system OmpR family sensor kinase